MTWNSKINNFRTYVNRLQGERSYVEESLQTGQAELKQFKKDLLNHEKAKEVIKEAGYRTQKQLQYHIANITTLALDTVFSDEDYDIKIKFVERRGKTECDIVLDEGDTEISPMDESGGGLVDVLSLALRIASWSMSVNKTRNVIVLDEPLKHLSPEYKEKGSELIKQISEKLNVQFIIINHEPILTQKADRVFYTSINRKKITKISYE